MHDEEVLLVKNFASKIRKYRTLLIGLRGRKIGKEVSLLYFKYKKIFFT